jgi:hypothetical protein
MTPVLRPAVLTLIPLLALAACTETPYEYFVWRKHAETVQFAPEPLYCYRTLAKVDCFAQPLDRSQHDRLVNYYGPPPGRPVLVPVAVPVNGRNGTVIDHPPLAAPREVIESEPLPVAPAAPPATTGRGPIPLTRTP